ncbi:HIT family protein [Salinadaptatus halalkaliphilus]|uniref:HIT family protein n=1 Tax=Salinadaptatus halalkaliphilus TaxID=2419781 RepID=A0A4S3TSH1_9EURY|nr:HIT family protein [Salinadaptatus halalkaliphilus]THE66660.1 HIT family protein [Salinadaptatus halalkaliphilus]
MSSADGCTFCSIIDDRDGVETLLESESYLCILDAYPVNEGHALVIPKTHVRYLEDVCDTQMFEFLQKALAKVNAIYEPDATTIGVNNGTDAGQTIPTSTGTLSRDTKGT